MNDFESGQPALLTPHWWSAVIRGIIAIIFGILCFLWPGFGLEVVVLIFGIYALADGLFFLITAANMREADHKGGIVIGGLAGICVGLFVIVWPQVAILGFYWIIIFWALITGIFELIAAFNCPTGIAGKWLLITSGIFSIIIGFILLAHPRSGVVAISWLIGIYALAAGLALLGLGLKLRAAR